MPRKKKQKKNSLLNENLGQDPIKPAQDDLAEINKKLTEEINIDKDLLDKLKVVIRKI